MSKNGASQGAEFSMARILVVDDNEQMLELTGFLLSQGGFEVSLAQDAQQALAILDDGRIVDAIILDVMLPEVDGLTLCKSIRARQIAVPILMVSAESDSQTAALEAGANEYLTK